MEQLLTENDKLEAKKFAETTLTHDYSEGLEDGYLAACSCKNNQMQEFDKWKIKNGWSYNDTSDKYCLYEEVQQDSPNLIDEKSFSELFEIFIKETAK